MFDIADLPEEELNDVSVPRTPGGSKYFYINIIICNILCVYTYFMLP
jgi:hypothetical protein